MIRERKYLKNPCVVCGQEQIGLHHHEGDPDIVYKKLMKYKSFRESTARTREDKLRRALQRRRKLKEMS